MGITNHLLTGMILQAGSFIWEFPFAKSWSIFFEKQKSLSPFHSLGEVSRIPSFMGHFFHNPELIKGRLYVYM